MPKKPPKPTTHGPVGQQAATHTTPGPDADLRARLVPGRAGKPPALRQQTLAAQKTDFTAEGSPPPGKVSTTAPVRSSGPDAPVR